MSFDTSKPRSVSDFVNHAQRDLPDGTTAQQIILVDEATGHRVNINADGSITISASSLPLPTGAATSANQTNGNQVTKIKETAPDDASKYNPSTKFSFNASNQIVKIEKTFGGVTKTQTTDVTDQTITSTVTYSSWA